MHVQTCSLQRETWPRPWAHAPSTKLLIFANCGIADQRRDEITLNLFKCFTRDWAVITAITASLPGPEHTTVIANVRGRPQGRTCVCARDASPTHGHARRSACAPSAHDCAPRSKATRLAPGARFCDFFGFSRVGHSRIRRILDGRHDAAVGGDGRGRLTLAKPAGRSRWTSGMPARTMGGQTRGALARVGLRAGRLMAPSSPCADTAEVLLDRNRRAIDARRLAAACTPQARAAWTRDRVYGQLCMQLYNHGAVRRVKLEA